MRIVLSWLRRLCPTELSAEELAEVLTAKGAEVESIEYPWAGLSGVMVARVIEVRDHPKSDRLCVARVQTGSGEQEVVVGVRNMGAGDLVPLAPPGSRVPTLPEPLQAREIRGVVSNGMLAAPDELGVSASHEGILILPDALEPGTDVASAYGLGGAVLDIEVTPNRPDFLSVLGIAREVSAATGTPLSPPVSDPPEVDEAVDGRASVRIDDLERCPRYLARVIRGVRDVPSPIAVQAELTAAGMRPISAAVDATNYAMLEIGQPLHPFDLTLLAGPGIVVRRAAEGETLVTLDEVERKLTEDDLLICDLERPVAVAGVMGGALAEVSGSTTDILLESASFQREGIQRTRRRLELSTEASTRFERGVDPEAPPVGAGRAAALMAEWIGAEVLRGVVEAGGPPSRRRVAVRPSRASLLIGSPVDRREAERVFDRLGIAHETDRDDRLVVEVPGYRVDIEREVDLIEEIARIEGYDRVGSRLPPVRQAGGLPEPYAFRRRLRSSLERAGLHEVRSIPFVSDADLERFGDRDAVRVTNPLQPEDGWLRVRLLPGLLRSARRNVARHVRSVALFETSAVWTLDGETPRERTRTALVMTGAPEPSWTAPARTFDVFDAKGAVGSLLDDLGIAWSTEPLAEPAFHRGRAGTIVAEDGPLGVFGELHPSIAAAYDLPGRVAVGELDAERLAALVLERREVHDVPRFPPLRRDLAFEVPAEVPAAALADAIGGTVSELVDDVVLFDVFEGPPLLPGRKSLAFAIDFRAPDRTLTDDEADAAVAAIVENVRQRLGGELRTR